MEMLYIKRKETYSINLKTYLVKYNRCYNSMISYLERQCYTVNILEVSRFCEAILNFSNDPWGLSGAWKGGMHGVLFQFPVGVPWRRVCVPMKGERRNKFILLVLQL